MYTITSSGVEQVVKPKHTYVEDEIKGAYNVAFTQRHTLMHRDPLRAIVELDNLLIGMARSTSTKEGREQGIANLRRRFELLTKSSVSML